MKSFTHHNAKSLGEVLRLLAHYKGKAKPIAGGTDLLGVLKEQSLPEYPEAIVNLKTIPGLAYIHDNEEGLRIGTLTTLSALTASSAVREQYKILYDAARSVATPQIRNVATLGGNLCQEVRCWYYRYPEQIGGTVQCLRKGKNTCLAVGGDNRYHAIMGGKRCFAVCPSDTATALAVLDGRIKIKGRKVERDIAVTELYSPLGNAIEKDEIVTEIVVPKISNKAVQTFLKFTLRKPVDFALVSVATIVTIENGVCTDARIALGAVAPAPVRAKAAEERLLGNPITEETAVKAAELAIAGARPLSKNEYKIKIAKTLVKRSLLEENL